MVMTMPLVVLIMGSVLDSNLQHAIKQIAFLTRYHGDDHRVRARRSQRF